MKKITLILLFSFVYSHSQNFSYETEEGNELEKIIDNNDTLKIIELHKNYDNDFGNEWTLNKIQKKAEIDHFMYGYIFEWTKQKSDTTYYRTYVFDIDTKLYSSSEKRKIKDNLISRGSVNIEKNKLKFISQAYRKKDVEEFEVDYYEYKFFENSKVVAIYRTENLNHLYMLTLKKNKEKIQLIKGKVILKIKK
jgi:hypothetical protein